MVASGFLLLCSVVLSGKCALNLFALENLDDVAFADIFIAFEGHAAFLTGLDLFDLILEAFEGFQRAFVDDHIVAQQAHSGRPACDAFGDQATGNLTDAMTLNTSLIVA